MEITPLIQAANLSRRFGGNRAVTDLSFEVQRGEVLGLLGPNGAGKTTTLRMLTGNLAPTAGSIRVNGFDLLDEPKQAKAALGYLPEQPPLYPELTVAEYLSYCARLNRIAKGEQTAAVQRAAERCGLLEVMKRLIGNLSKGYQQRVGIAQAIIHRPEVVILDEPTVGLDPHQIREVRQLIRELAAEHSVILSSHILPEIEATCDRVLIISQGRLLLDDSIDGLRRRMQQASFSVALQRPPAVSTLEAVEGVQAVSRLDDQRFRIDHATERNPAETLVKAAVEGDWGLFELVPETRSLEEIFVSLTTEENAES